MRELGIRPSGGIRVDSSTSVEAWDKDPKADSKLIAETFAQAARHRRRPRRVHRRRRRDSAGAACIPGARCATSSKRSTGPARSATRPTWRTRCSTPSATTPRPTASCRRTSTGPTPRRSTPPTARSPTRCAPGPSTSTSPRTTAPSSAPATTRRPAATAASTTRTAASTSSSTPASGCATTNGKLTKTMRHICWDACMLPNAVMEDQADLERRPRRHGQGPRRPRLDGVRRWPRISTSA